MLSISIDRDVLNTGFIGFKIGWLQWIVFPFFLQYNVITIIPIDAQD